MSSNSSRKFELFITLSSQLYKGGNVKCLYLHRLLRNRDSWLSFQKALGLSLVSEPDSKFEIRNSDLRSLWTETEIIKVSEWKSESRFREGCSFVIFNPFFSQKVPLLTRTFFLGENIWIWRNRNTNSHTDKYTNNGLPFDNSKQVKLRFYKRLLL